MTHPLFLSLPERLEGDRIYLRPYKHGDGQEFYSILQENKDHLSPHVNEIPSITSVEKAEIRNRGLYGNWVSRQRYVLPIFTNDTDQMIGEIWIEPIKAELGIYELGYFIVKSHEGQGFVTEASQLSLEFLFDHLEASKVEIHTDDTNTRSYAVAERLGFTKEGHLRARTETMGKIVGRLYYGLLKQEFHDMQSKNKM